VYCENLHEMPVASAADALKLAVIGAQNRRVAATAMNRESSRSHALFCLTITSKEVCADSPQRSAMSSSLRLFATRSALCDLISLLFYSFHFFLSSRFVSVSAFSDFQDIPLKFTRAHPLFISLRLALSGPRRRHASPHRALPPVRSRRFGAAERNAGAAH
jgi:hypothetical protein